MKPRGILKFGPHFEEISLHSLGVFGEHRLCNLPTRDSGSCATGKEPFRVLAEGLGKEHGLFTRDVGEGPLHRPDKSIPAHLGLQKGCVSLLGSVQGMQLLHMLNLNSKSVLCISERKIKKDSSVHARV